MGARGGGGGALVNMGARGGTLVNMGARGGLGQHGCKGGRCKK